MTRALQQPLYATIQAHLLKLITRGDGLKSPLPAEDKLARTFGVSRMTAREAYRRLEQEGVVVRRRGVGTFAVPPRVHEALDQLGRVGISQQWAIQGHHMGVVVRRYEIVPAPEEIAAEFGVAAGASLTYLDRVRFADGIPATWDERYTVPDLWSRVQESEFRRATLLEILFRVNLPAREGEFEISAENCPPDLAEVLGVKAQSALLVRRLRFFDANGKLLVVGVSKAPADRVSYRLHVDVNETTGARTSSLDVTATVEEEGS